MTRSDAGERSFQPTNFALPICAELFSARPASSVTPQSSRCGGTFNTIHLSASGSPSNNLTRASGRFASSANRQSNGPDCSKPWPLDFGPAAHVHRPLGSQTEGQQSRTCRSGPPSVFPTFPRPWLGPAGRQPVAGSPPGPAIWLTSTFSFEFIGTWLI